jgi:sigma54-dependent transcription regulator
MKSCLLFAVFSLLLVSNGYAILQVVTLREEIARLRQEVEGMRPAPASPEALSGLAASALEALRRGDTEAARGELDHLSARVRQMKTLAEGRRAELERLTAQAKQALTEKRDTAANAIQRLLDGVRADKEPAGRQEK